MDRVLVLQLPRAGERVIATSQELLGTLQSGHYSLSSSWYE